MAVSGAGKPLIAVLGVSLFVMACGSGSNDEEEPAGTSSEVTAEPSTTTDSPAGQIVFQRAGDGDVLGEGESDVYLVDAEGDEGDVRLLVEQGAAGRWSPDGTEVSVFCCGDGMAAHLVDVETGDVRVLEPPDPALETNCIQWSPDGERLACESFGIDDESRNGIYSILSADGGGLQRITSNPAGFDVPGDYSPDGSNLVFMRFEDEVPIGLFVIDIAANGAGSGEPRQLTPPGMVLDDSGHGGRWSPDGARILFVARESEEHHKAIWILDVASGASRQLSITPGCGGPNADGEAHGCYSPAWSPDGDRIVFTRSEPDASNESIWVVNSDGSDLEQLTDGTDDGPSWGPPR
jgi:Tol biopolymer transport system component